MGASSGDADPIDEALQQVKSQIPQIVYSLGQFSTAQSQLRMLYDGHQRSNPVPVPVPRAKPAADGAASPAASAGPSRPAGGPGAADQDAAAAGPGGTDSFTDERERARRLWEQGNDPVWRRHAAAEEVEEAWCAAALFVETQGDPEAAAALQRIEMVMRNRWPDLMEVYDAERLRGGSFEAAMRKAVAENGPPADDGSARGPAADPEQAATPTAEDPAGGVRSAGRTAGPQSPHPGDVREADSWDRTAGRHRHEAAPERAAVDDPHTVTDEHTQGQQNARVRHGREDAATGHSRSALVLRGVPDPHPDGTPGRAAPGAPSPGRTRPRTGGRTR